MQPPSVALIYGSIRPERFCGAIARWTADRVASHGIFRCHALDCRLDWPFQDEEGLRLRLGEVDAFLIVAPEYHHSYSGALKMLVDTVPDVWAAKPVAFVSYGGTSGGARAIEHLRCVFAELHAVTMPNAVSFHDPWESFSQDGQLSDPHRHDRSMAVTLSQLLWWSNALKMARDREGYAWA